MERAWAGVDAGKTHYHCVVVDTDSRRLLSRRITNDETALTELIGSVLALAETITWAVDLADGGTALLTGHDQ